VFAFCNAFESIAFCEGCFSLLLSRSRLRVEEAELATPVPPAPPLPPPSQCLEWLLPGDFLSPSPDRFLDEARSPGDAAAGSVAVEGRNASRPAYWADRLMAESGVTGDGEVLFRLIDGRLFGEDR
jgi:hypothetical protein